MEKKNFDKIVSRIFKGKYLKKQEKDTNIRKQKLEAGAKDFAIRFETVMQELSNG